ncbi:hypothetical protein MVEN_01165400 [Mycena venus]|uniref:HTH CENPB-type domain-containing protein n=1 Tax=Mycena venus TaxID=2733690 RepID=A0A8H7CXX4_9AGAR|nr:hypothetical protein MVEN_01165400 [Mycena venus]
MVSRAKSERVKGHANSRRKELNIRGALHEYEREQAKPAILGKPKSIRAIAESHKVSYGTLHRHIHGGRGIREANQEKQKVSPVQEWSLVQFILESADRGFPLNHAQIRQAANAVRESTLGTGCELVSDKWVFAFLDRHHDALRTFWSKALDTQRARSLNPEAVKSWVDLVQKWIVDKGVSPDRIYGMDESGYPTGYTGKERVVGARGTKTQHKQGGASRQNITALVTIRGDGKMVVPPMVIFPGVNYQTAWNNGNTINAFIAKSINGWTNGELGYEWLVKVFDPATKEEANGLPRVLLLDGHSSHYSQKFLDYARANNIILLGYPPHCTHALQGLDVVCFAKHKACWQAAIVAFETRTMREVSKAEFMTVWVPAYLEAFDESTVRAAFKVTGVAPFNPDFVTAEQMKPSLATSTRAEFPMPQPSPVRAITNAMRIQPPTRFDLSPSNAARAPQASTSRTPQTPSRRRGRDEDLENLDPALWSPSKKMRTLSSPTTILSSPPVIQGVPSSIATPNWSLSTPDTSNEPYRTRSQLEAEIAALQKELALAHQNVAVRDQIIEEGNATMVFQNMGLKKMNEALHQQEEKAATDRARLFKGKAQCLSSDEFYEAVKAIEEGRKAKEVGKEAKKVARQKRKELREEIEREWGAMKERHVAEVEAWSEECSGLLQEGTRKKDLPPKPKLGKKPTLPAADDDEDELEEEEADV